MVDSPLLKSSNVNTEEQTERLRCLGTKAQLYCGLFSDYVNYVEIFFIYFVYDQGRNHG